MATTITHPDTREVMPLGAVYWYDQLNRITEMKGYANFDFTNNVWKAESFDGSMFFSNYSYDANGNLLSLQRNNQAGVMFDNFAYQYQKVGGKTISNRLYHVFGVLMSNERLEKFGIRTKYTELETKPVSKQSSSQVFGFLIGMNDDVSMSNIMSDDIDDQGVFTEEDNKIANNYAAMA